MKAIRLMLKGLLALVGLLLASCEHKELCYTHPHEVRIRVDFDWIDAPDANPEGMCVFFYSMTDGSSRRFDFSGLHGGYISILPGKYRVMCYNNDTETVLFHNTDDYDRHGVYTRQGEIDEVFSGNASRNGTPRAEGTEKEKLIVCPEMMWGCTAINVVVDEAGIEYICEPETPGYNKPATVDEYVIMLYPHELVCTYTYEIRNVKNLSHMSQFAATLSGMAGQMNFDKEYLTSTPSTLMFDGNRYDDTTITGKFYTFGHSLESEALHRMTIFVILDNGEGKVFGLDSKTNERFNVTEQVHNAPNRRRVHLIIDGLDIPQPISNGSGFSPTIDDWDVVNETIII